MELFRKLLLRELLFSSVGCNYLSDRLHVGLLFWTFSLCTEYHVPSKRATKI
jgi:hypothetical protein